MRRYLELTLAGGKEIDLPPNSVITFEEMDEETNPNYPTARSFLRYQIEGEVTAVLLEDKIDDLVMELDINVKPDWIKLTKTGEKDHRLYLRADSILARQQQDEGCLLTVQVGGVIKQYLVKESRRQVKKLSEKTQTSTQEEEQ